MIEKSVKAKIPQILIDIQDKFGADDQGYLNTILSRDDCAGIVGTATESAIRILLCFKRKVSFLPHENVLKFNVVIA